MSHFSDVKAYLNFVRKERQQCTEKAVTTIDSSSNDILADNERGKPDYVSELLCISEKSNISLPSREFDNDLIDLLSNQKNWLKFDDGKTQMRKRFQRGDVAESLPTPEKIFPGDSAGAVEIIRIVHNNFSNLQDENIIQWLLTALMCLDEVDIKQSGVSAHLESVKRKILQKYSDCKADNNNGEFLKVWEAILKYIASLMKF